MRLSRRNGHALGRRFVRAPAASRCAFSAVCCASRARRSSSLASSAARLLFASASRFRWRSVSIWRRGCLCSSCAARRRPRAGDPRSASPASASNPGGSRSSSSRPRFTVRRPSGVAAAARSVLPIRSRVASDAEPTSSAAASSLRTAASSSRRALSKPLTSPTEIASRCAFSSASPALTNRCISSSRRLASWFTVQAETLGFFSSPMRVATARSPSFRKRRARSLRSLTNSSRGAA